MTTFTDRVNRRDHPLPTSALCDAWLADGHRFGAAPMGLDPDRVVLTLDRHGNTSAASVPLALAEAADDGRLQPGDLVLASAVGAGMTWGSILLRWGGAA